MKNWVFTFRVDPPTGTVVSARNGGSVFFAGYSRLLRQWFMVYPGGEEKIDEPQMLFVEDEYAKAHERQNVGRRPTIKLRESKTKPIQFELGLSE